MALIKCLSLLFIFVIGLLPTSQAQEGLFERLGGGLDSVPASSAEIQLTFAPVVKRAKPAVVNIYATRMVRQSESPFANDPFFDRFFSEQLFGRTRPRVKNDLGSGVIVDASGIVVTNFHVIQNAVELKIVLSDGQEFGADIVLTDQDSDLAVLRLQSDGDVFPFLEFALQANVEVGDLVLAIGNPFGVGQTVTQGIVSALARSQQAGSISNSNFFIQTDAAINPGNSGGALVDMNGDIVGINTAIYSRSGGSVGIGFAVPSDMVRTVVNSALGGSKRVQRPWIGARYQNIDADLADTLNMQRPNGVIVTDVKQDSPADVAGLEIGDVIVDLNGKKIRDLNAFNYHLATVGVGRRAEMMVLRDGAADQINVDVIAPPETVARDERRLDGRHPLSGVVVANLSPKLADELRFGSAEEGVIVLDVGRRSFARRFGVRSGDIIVEVNGEQVVNTGQLAELLANRSTSWRFSVNRDGKLLRSGNIPG